MIVSAVVRAGRTDQAETSVLFELISARYERRWTVITANQPWGEWNRSSRIRL